MIDSRQTKDRYTLIHESLLKTTSHLSFGDTFGPEKRSQGELLHILKTISIFEANVDVCH